MHSGNETFLKAYDSYSHKSSYMCNYKIKSPGFTHTRVDHIHIFCKQSRSRCFNCYIQSKTDNVWKN